ncbi:hypothetical protein JAAARDRAFT_167436 [Jaapia argillacea MUCL 33604]|uniref:Methyltransferase domain-containing protein n=1 Tax=Jaapia argillacea MUCL 33604 TaxID=933084 RepID=A0A067QMN3_9AGAM|nr:hypothetical protein JAAARDRAFT_167436 [Jaapia argillacea MUCL 33604]
MSTHLPHVISNEAHRARLKELAKEGPTGWDKAWKEQVTPWDAGQVQPPLRDLIQSGELDLPKSGKALVPGCGRGYDAIFIASSLGLDTLGVDISQTAVDAANELLASSPPTSGKASFEIVDFFTFSVPETEKFDLVYDYTFFVAILPTMRPDWARQMTGLVKPGGYLITLVFPLHQTDSGPPFPVEPSHYEELLSSDWDRVHNKVPEHGLPSHVGRQQMVVWKRRS